MTEIEELESGLSKSLNSYLSQQQSSAKGTSSILPKRRKPLKTEHPSQLATQKGTCTSVQPKKPWKPSESKPRHRITLRVYRKPTDPYELFTVESSKLSRIEAKFEAEKAAKEAGLVVAFEEEWEEI